MGMDLSPIAAKSDYTLPGWSEPCAVSYNWNGWSYLKERLDEWRVDVSEFTSYNDGDVISDATCKSVADALSKHLDDLNDKDRKWLEPHIRCWRDSGGFEQW